ncbi:hypothetical protein GTA09_21515 [Rhodococcus hoagii]|nr:hypothetical protein [Prescottella equi]NKZ72003.1 hypothetical protein [Prescottella equi]
MNDETEYLLSSPAHAERLSQAYEGSVRGEGVERDLIEDETEYLLSTEANAKFLRESIAELSRGAVVKRPTEAEIEAARTPAGGWTRETLAAWGVPWPPPKGWRKQFASD